MVVNAKVIVAISVVGRATVTRNVLGALLIRLVMSKPLNSRAAPSRRVSVISHFDIVVYISRTKS